MPNSIRPDGFDRVDDLTDTNRAENLTNTGPRHAGRAETNRANAQYSTGPRTETGKQNSRLNALRHGLTGQTVVLPPEDLAAYQRHSQSFVDEYRPKGATEAQLVQLLSDTAWRLNRIAALETNLFSLGITEQTEKITVHHPQAQDALAMALAFRKHERSLAALSTYSQRLHRQFERTLAQLRQLQAERFAAEKDQLQHAARILKMHKAQALPGRAAPYDPAQDGFVFSVHDIETYSRRQDRDGQAYHHYLHSPD